MSFSLYLAQKTREKDQEKIMVRGQFHILGNCLNPVEMATQLEGIFDIFIHTQFDMNLSQSWKCSTGSVESTKNYSTQNNFVTFSEVSMSIKIANPVTIIRVNTRNK